MDGNTMDNKPDTTDDFLKDVGESDFLDNESSTSNPSIPTSTSNPTQWPTSTSVSEPVTLQPLQKDTPDSLSDLPDLMGSEYPQEYIRVVERIKFQYKMLPSLNYDAIYREISELSIKSSPTPTLEILMDELHKVQAAKDRLSEICIDVIKCYNFKKRAIDILKDSWGKFTSEKNAEGRKGDASFRMSHFVTDFAITEALSKSCDHIFKNLDSLQDNLSRRITIWQLILKLREGRMALPDFDFSKEVDKSSMDGLFSDNKGENKEEENEVKLMEF
jgi:hypothetical protein